MRVECLHDELTPIKALKPHPKNPNTHTDAQIERLAQILEYQGWRYPIKVSKRSGYITSGHGRLLAAKKNKWSEVPVNYQEYESDEQEYADVVSDNAIAEWAQLDLAMINVAVPDLGPNFDINWLGIKDFEIEPADKFVESEHWIDMPEFEQGDNSGVRQIIVHFQKPEDVIKFFNLIEQSATDKTKSIWFPKRPPDSELDKIYKNES